MGKKTFQEKVLTSTMGDEGGAVHDDAGEQRQLREIEDEMKYSYMDYAMSVIVGRALPDVRDGLKPVHRRVLYTMYTTGVTANKPYRKSANIVGNCMARFHPHGDSSIYDTLVRMTQPFSLRYILVDGQGNFGSIDGDNAAAMRYTEARMTKLAEQMLADIDKETVDFMGTFDNSSEEPVVLPSKVPNLLVNGSSGIAVGMATNVPPHNMGEIASAMRAMIADPDITVDELMQHVTGPDFPTGGIIQGNGGIRQAYHSGRGRVVVRCSYHTETRKKGAENIIITEIPYFVNKSLLLEQIADLVKEKRVEGISDIRDESDRDGMRVVIELKSDANTDVVMNHLYKHSRLQESFGVNMLALVDNVPKTLSLRDMLLHFINHRREVVRKRTEYDLRKAEEKAHILEGLIIALDHIDAVIEKIKKSKNPKDAAERLMEDYELTEKQAQVILEMRLQKLSSMEQEKVRSDYKGTLELIDELKAILADPKRIDELIDGEVQELVKSHGDGRRTRIEEGEEYDIDVEDLIDEEDMIITVTNAGYVKRMTLDTYREQKRGGKGIIATGRKEDDHVNDVFVANTHDYLLIFTNTGRVFWLKTYKVPLGTRHAKGTAIVNLVDFEKGEHVSSIVPIRDFTGNVLMCTKNGIIKKVPAEHFSRPRRTGIVALGLQEGDELISTRLTTGEDECLIATRKGMAVRFKETDVRPMGRTAVGVTGVRLGRDDAVIGMVLVDTSHTLLTITENGFGKRSRIEEYRLIKRGGKGVRNIIRSARNGDVVAVRSVAEEDSLVIVSMEGQAIRISVKDIACIGRNTQGVRLMRLSTEDAVVAVANVPASDDDGDGGSTENETSDAEEA